MMPGGGHGGKGVPTEEVGEVSGAQGTEGSSTLGPQFWSFSRGNRGSCERFKQGQVFL